MKTNYSHEEGDLIIFRKCLCKDKGCNQGLNRKSKYYKNGKGTCVVSPDAKQKSHHCLHIFQGKWWFVCTLFSLRCNQETKTHSFHLFECRRRIRKALFKFSPTPWNLYRVAQNTSAWIDPKSRNLLSTTCMLAKGSDKSVLKGWGNLSNSYIKHIGGSISSQ